MNRGLLISLILLIAFQSKAQFKLYEQGLDAYQKKDYANSIALLIEYLDKPVRDKALDVDVRYWLALSYFKTQSYTAAIREFVFGFYIHLKPNL